MGDTVLYDRIGNASVKVETPSIGSNRIGPVVMGNAILNQEIGTIPDPDAYRSIPGPWHIPSVVECLTIFNGSVFYGGGEDPVPTVII